MQLQWRGTGNILLYFTKYINNTQADMSNPLLFVVSLKTNGDTLTLSLNLLITSDGQMIRCTHT